MRIRRPALGLCLLAAACATAPQSLPPADPVGAAAAGITAARVQRHIERLADDDLRGRDTPSPGLELAASYLATELERSGVQSAGVGYIQRFPFERVGLDRARLRVEARTAGSTITPQFAREFFIIPAAVDSVVGTPIYAGTAGATRAPPENARGAILVYYVPGSVGEEWQGRLSAALQSAFVAGAAAAVLALDSVFDPATLQQIADEAAGQVLPLPVVGMRYDVARAILALGGLDLGSLRSDPAAPGGPLTGLTLLVRPAVEAATHQAPNVVGLLAGSDPLLRNEYVVLSAHFDHVGVGTPDEQGDSIYNGADDNASGTAAMLEVARALASLDRRPARSILFAFVSAEEKGLLGSAHFVAQPPVPLERMAANINVDMIGRNAPDTIVAIGQDYSSLGPTIQRIAAAHPALGLTVAPDLWPEEQLFFRSDHFSFAAREVPAIFFTSGLHEDYHAPSDEAGTIDSDKVARVARLILRVTHDLATAPDRPRWTEEGLAEVRRQTGGAR